jgi:hypothetical protein
MPRGMRQIRATTSLKTVGAMYWKVSALSLQEERAPPGPERVHPGPERVHPRT